MRNLYAPEYVVMLPTLFRLRSLSTKAPGVIHKTWNQIFSPVAGRLPRLPCNSLGVEDLVAVFVVDNCKPCNRAFVDKAGC